MIGQPVNDFILVEFDPVPTIAGLIIPERYKIQDGDEDEPTAYGVNTNRKAINPQVITIIKGNGDWLDWIGETYPEYEKQQILKSTQRVLPGERYFVYYGAYEIAKWMTNEQALIPAKTILFGIEPIRPAMGTYLGDEVFTEGEKTASGIYITPYAEKKEGVLIKITHIPQEGGIGNIKVGDTVVTVDSYQYDLRYENKKYIKLRSSEIVGVKKGDGYIPVGDRVLVEYLPDEDLAERIAENEKRFQILETMSRKYLHLGDMPNGELQEHLRPVKEPKFTQARLLATGEDVNLLRCIGDTKIGDTTFVFRYEGCLLPNGQWITGIDNIVGVMVV